MTAAALEGDYILTAARVDQDTRGIGTIRMYPSRSYVQPLDLKPEHVHIGDIIHHLSQINRYTGGTPKPYSVLHHSLIVAAYFRGRPANIRLAALFHDAEEAYLNDIASPVKKDLRMQFFVDAAEHARATIFGVLGIDPALESTVIKPIDDLVFHREVASFFGNMPSTDPDFVRPLPVAVVQQMFVTEYRRIQKDWPKAPAI